MNTEVADHEHWECYLVNAGEFNERWGPILGLPGTYVAGITPDGKYRQVALSESRVEWLHKYGFPIMCGRSTRYDVSQPGETEICVHGQWEAERKAERRVIQGARRAIESGHGMGLDLYLRYNTPNKRVHEAIEWLLLERLIKVSTRGQIGHVADENIGNRRGGSWKLSDSTFWRIR